MVRRTRHAAYEIRYHFVGVPKYRRKVLVGGIPERLTVLLSEKTQEMGGEIIDLAIQPDQVHLFGIFPPTLAPHPIMHGLKGYTAFMLRKAFPPPQEPTSEYVDPFLLRRHSRKRVGSNHPALH